MQSFRRDFVQEHEGDSLIEVLVSLALVSLIAMAVLPLFLGSRVLLRTGTQMAQGTTVAERDVARVRSLFSAGESTARENCQSIIDTIVTGTSSKFPLSISPASKQYAGKLSITRVLYASSDSHSQTIPLSDIANELQDDATETAAKAAITTFCEAATPDPADSAAMTPRALSLRYTVTVTAPSTTSGSSSSVTAASLSTNVLLLNSPS